MTDADSANEGIAATIVAALEAVAAGAIARVSLSERAERIAGRIGAAWFARAVAALVVAYPGTALELVLEASDRSPLEPPEKANLADGQRYVDERSVGRISLWYEGDSRSPIRRTVVLPGEQLLDGAGDFHFIAPVGLKRRAAGWLYGELYKRAPLALDVWRQQRNTWVEGRRGQMEAKAPKLRGAGPIVSADQDPPVAWFALHWLGPGGAESWALESAELAAKAGFRVVLTVDVPGAHELLERALAITPDVYLAANVLVETDWDPFLTNLLSRTRPSLIHIHHSRRAYAALPDVRHAMPDVTIVDSVHIIEHRTGGFVRQSIEYSELIDLHHVISPELRDVYLLDANVEPAKVAYYPLTNPDLSHREPRPRPDGPLRVGFLGRLAPQKRPFLFVSLAERLHRADPGAFAFVIQGDGVLGPIVSDQVRKAGLQDVVERMPWGPVDRFMDAVDVLVISSDNEGLTLTTLEADEHGVLVLSADVGSQRSVIAPDLLVPRPPHAFLKVATARLRKIARSPEAYERARAQQSDLVRRIGLVEPASTHFATYYAALEENR